MSSCCETPAFTPPSAPPESGALRTVALIGPPNSGKSTLFNRLTGLRQKVANYPGVTVEQRMGLMAGIGRDDLTLIDLPGIYSLSPYSEDARVSIDVLQGKMPGTPRPDAVLLVLDSQHLTRQLMLAAPVLAVGLPTMVLLNMSDLMESRGGQIDALSLARELGAPVAQISAVNGTGLDAVPLFLNQHNQRQSAQPLSLPVLGNAASTHTWAAQISHRTGYQAPLSAENTRKIDNILLHRIWGPLLFLMVVVGVFEVVFTIGQPLSDWFGDVLAFLANVARPLRHLEGRLVRACLPAPDPAAVSLHRHPGRHRLPGPRRAHRRPRHAHHRPQRQGFHPAALRLRLRRPGHHGHAHH